MPQVQVDWRYAASGIHLLDVDTHKDVAVLSIQQLRLLLALAELKQLNRQQIRLVLRPDQTSALSAADRASASRTLRRLMNTGLVERLGDRYRLTPNGAELLELITQNAGWRRFRAMNISQLNTAASVLSQLHFSVILEALIGLPKSDLLSNNECVRWLESFLHPEGLVCPHCRSAKRRLFHKRDYFPGYRCLECAGYYTLLSSSVFEKTRQTPVTLVRLLRGVARGEANGRLSQELGIGRKRLTELRHAIQNYLYEQLTGAMLDEPTP